MNNIIVLTVKKKGSTACSTCESEISKASPSSALVQYDISLKEMHNTIKLVILNDSNSKIMMVSTHYYYRTQQNPQLSLLLKSGGNKFLNH